MTGGWLIERGGKALRRVPLLIEVACMKVKPLAQENHARVGPSPHLGVSHLRSFHHKVRGLVETGRFQNGEGLRVAAVGSLHDRVPSPCQVRPDGGSFRWVAFRMRGPREVSDAVP